MRLIKTFNLLDQSIRFNLFVFSRTFFMGLFTGFVVGIIVGFYWTVLEYFTEFLAYFQGWLVIPIMARCGLLAGLVIHFIGDPG